MIFFRISKRLMSFSWDLLVGFQRDIYRNIYSTSNTPATFGIIIWLSNNSATQVRQFEMKLIPSLTRSYAKEYRTTL